FISLNSNLSSLEILTQYAERWSIELFFKNCKGNLGLNRYLLLMLINYTYCSLSSKGTNYFNI
ncbi:MAG: IS701 family transposase, partial [Sarcina sp.]